MTEQSSSRARAFILRLWQDDDVGQAWRCSLEEIGRSLPRRGFRDLASLTAFLNTEFDHPVHDAGEGPASDDAE